MNKLLGVACGVALLGAMLPAQAEEPYQEMRPYVSLAYSYVFEEDDRDELLGTGSSRILEEGEGWQFGAGRAINKWFGFEVSAFSHNFSRGPDGAAALGEYGLKLDGLFFYSRNPKFSPYFGVGIGGVRTDIKGAADSSTDPFADVGLGFMRYFSVGSADLALRADARYRQIFFDDDALGGTSVDDVGEPILNLGIVIPIGKKPGPAAAAAPAAGPCADADGDGVCDSADLCPETPKGTAVDAKGCPVEDGGKGANRKFEDVYFAFDRSDLTDYSRAVLDNAAKVIKQLGGEHPQLKVQVDGHTDSIGTDGYNQGLSERRATTVKRYLEGKGVDGKRINLRAYGETRPKATNESSEGQALNRRAEVSTSEK